MAITHTLPLTTLKQLIGAARQRAYLVQVSPVGGDHSRINLGKLPRILGRDETCDIHLEDSSVSRQHARITPEEDGYYVVDLQSTNGTFVNDQQVTRSHLADGDHLRLGSYTFRFLLAGNSQKK